MPEKIYNYYVYNHGPYLVVGLYGWYVKQASLVAMMYEI